MITGKQRTIIKNKLHRLLIRCEDAQHESSLSSVWIDIPQPDAQPIPVHIRRVDVSKFDLYVLYDKHQGKKRREFGRGGVQRTGITAVSEATESLLDYLTTLQRARPMVEDLPLFAPRIQPEAIPA